MLGNGDEEDVEKNDQGWLLDGIDSDYDDGWKGEHIPLSRRLRHGPDSIKKINSVRLVDLTKW